MKRIVILTGAELRHDYLRVAFGLEADLEVLRSYCEGTENTASTSIDAAAPGAEQQAEHFRARQASEHDFLEALTANAPDRSHPARIPRGTVNDREIVDEILALEPDLLVAYGCSIIKGRLLDGFRGRFVNVHLGLSPYYRGTGTNFWPLANGEPEFVGATFMHLSPEVDGGEVIHQVRAEMRRTDGPHEIGNRLIRDMVPHYVDLVRAFDRLPKMDQIPAPQTARYYRRRDFTAESLGRMHVNFETGMIARYLAEKDARDAAAPIVSNPGLAAERTA